MNESYKELLVKKDRGIKETLIRFLSLLPTVFLGFLTFVTGNMIFFIIVIALGVLDYFVFQWTDIEYEYLYLDKEISVDKIMAKTRRKRVATLSVERESRREKFLRSKCLTTCAGFSIIVKIFY